MRWTSTLATAGLAELAAHFLSIGWGFAVLLGGFCAVASLLRVTAAKVSGTEARLGAHITATAPAVNFVANGGSVGGSVTINGGHTVTGNSTTNGSHTVQGNLGVNGGTTLVGSSSCSNDFTTGGSHTVNSNLGVHGGTTMIGSSSCSGHFAINGGASMPNGSLGSAPGPPGGGTTSTYAGNFFNPSGALTWAQGVSNKVDAIISALQVNNVTN